MTRARTTVCSVLAAALLLCAAAAGCGPSEAPETDANGWIEQIRSALLASDAALQAEGPARAVERLRAALDAPVPRDIKPDHRRVVHQDLLFLIAELELRGTQGPSALAAADRGLSLGRAADLFTANLLIARGEALEALGRDTEAAASYYEALEINRELLHAALAQPDAGAP